MGKFEVDSDFSSVLTQTEDFIWFALHQVNLKNELEAEIELNTLQNVLTESYGESFFKASQQPIVFFCVLLLSVQFEKAIAYLAKCNHSKLL